MLSDGGPRAARRPAGVRAINTRVVLGLLWRHRRTSRTELIERSGLSKATISAIVADLLDRGLVREVGTRQHGRGRSRIVVELNTAARTVLGAQIEDEACWLVLTDLDGHPYASTSRALTSRAPAEVVDTLVAAVAELRARAPQPVLGLGVGVPGQVDRAGRRIIQAVSHGWSELPFADLLQERSGIPVVLANRAKVAALGQLDSLDGDRPRDLVYVFLGAGVVAGLVLDGRLYSGRDGGAGDIGHVTVDPGGELCGCGNRGCLHTVAAEAGMLALARAKAREAGPTCRLYTLTRGRLTDLTPAALAAAVRDGDPAAVATLDTVGAHLGVVLANLVNILNPQAVVVGGPGARLGERLFARIREEIRRRALSEAVDGITITADTGDQRSGAVGAAALWLARAAAEGEVSALLTGPPTGVPVAVPGA